MIEMLNELIFGNTTANWITAAVVILFSYLGIVLLKRLILGFVSRRQAAEKKGLDRLGLTLAEGTNSLFILVLALYLGSLALQLPESVETGMAKLLFVATVLQLTLWGSKLIDILVEDRIDARPEQAADTATTLHALSLVGKIGLWLLAGLLILENLTGIEMGAILATLGIGGVAIALAVQGILGDLFASISISLDRPFVIGDAIGIDDLSGEVEQIGLKSTRIRSVTGEQLVISNSDLLDSRLHNYRRRERRRVLFTLGINYGTPYAKLVQIPELLSSIIGSHEHTFFEYAVFQSYGESALDFEVSYVMETPDLQLFKETHHAINLEIYRRFETENIEISTPSQTIFLAQLAD
jgi:small-conductance mechanosensitive channel